MDLVSGIDEEFLQLTIKRQVTHLKNGQRFELSIEMSFSKDAQRANKLMKRFSMSLVFREM